jgi:hypothetical protein
MKKVANNYILSFEIGDYFAASQKLLKALKTSNLDSTSEDSEPVRKRSRGSRKPIYPPNRGLDDESNT